MKEELKRRETDALTEVQAANQLWWTKNTMSYDWNQATGIEKFSTPWFDEIDKRFVASANLFAHGLHPFACP
jgi:hypothetical protein